MADGSGGTLSGDTGAGSGNVATWTGEESSVEFSTSGQSRVTNITVSYQSSSIPTHAITYSVNSATNTVNVSEGSAVDLSAPAKSLIPVGYVFRGWRSATLA